MSNILKESALNTADGTNSSVKYLAFICDNQHYAFKLDIVKEIMKIQPFTIVPEFPLYCKGIINIRGDIVPVIDVRRRFKRPEIEYTDRACIIVVNSGEQYVGFIADAVDAVIDINNFDISPAPKITSSSVEYIEGIGKTDGKIILILDSDKLLSDDDHLTFSSYSKE